MDYSPLAPDSSTGSGTANYYHQTIGVSHDMDNPNILSTTAAWLPETDELKVFTSDGGRFLSGPGVIPVRQALPVPHDVGHEQDTQHPQLDGLVSPDDQQSVVTTQSQPGEPGDY
jgi:hypothetical protein